MVLKSSSLLGIKLTGHQAYPLMSALPAPSLGIPLPTFWPHPLWCPCWIQDIRSLESWLGGAY